MKNTVRFLVPSILVLGLGVVQCGGSDTTPVDTTVGTGGAGGSGGFTGVTGGTTGVTGGATGVTGGATGVTGGATGVTGGATGVTGGGTGVTGGSSGTGGTGGTGVTGGASGTGGKADSGPPPADAGPKCPTNLPTTGVTKCTTLDQVCDYTVGGFGGGQRECTCLSASGQDVWVCVTPPVEAAAPTCPAAANRPADNQRCTDTSLVCPYAAGGGNAAEVCSCETTTTGDRWNCVPADAGAPPPADAATCPATAPTAGDACTGALQCTYGGANCNCLRLGGQRVWFGNGCN